MSKPRVADAAEGQPVEPELEGERREEPQRQSAAEGEQKAPAETSRAEAAHDKVQAGGLKAPAEPLMGAQAVDMTEASTLALADQQIKTEGDSAWSEEQEKRQDSGRHGNTAHQSNTMEAEAREYWEYRNADAGWTAGKGERYQAGLARLGLNRPENIKALTEQWKSVDHDLAPMMVVPYKEFKKLGKLPRSSDRKAVPLSEVAQGGHIAFCSHNWMRGSKEQCERKGHKWEGSAHPDDEKGTKHTLLCASVEQLAKDKEWELGKVYIWLDFCGIEQDIVERKMAGVGSLRGYVAVCDAIIVPYPDAPPADASTVDRLKTYGERGWTRLEAMVAYIMGILRGLEKPDIFVAWREGESSVKVKQFDYSLDPDHLPASCGKEHLTDERDRAALEEHQKKLLEEMKASVKRNGYVTKHGGEVSSVAFHPTRRGVLASAGKDGVVKLVKQETGTTLLQMEGAGTNMGSIAFNKDGSLLAGCGEDVNIYLWDTQSGKKQGTLRGHSKDNPECTCTHQDYRPRYTANPESNPECPVRGHDCTVLSVAYSPDGKFVASGSGDTHRDGGTNCVKIWDAETMEEKGTLRWHSDWVACVAWNHDGSLLASGSNDTTVRLWTPDGQQKGTLRGHSGSVKSVAWNHDGSLLASAGGNGDETVRLWDPKTQEDKGTLRGHSDPVRCVAWNHDGSLLASASDDKTVKLWDPTTMEEKGTLTGHSRAVASVAFSPASQTLASASWDETVKLWDLSSGTPKEKGTLKGHSDQVHCVAFSPDSKTLASGSGGKTVKLWDLSGDAPVEKGTLRGHSNGVSSVAFSPDSKTLASASYDTTVKLWYLSEETPVEKCTLKGHDCPVLSVAYSPDGNFVASASGDTDDDLMGTNCVKIWSVETMEEKGTLRGPHKRTRLFQRFKGWLKGDDPRLVGTLRGHSKHNPKCLCTHGKYRSGYKANSKCPVRGHSDWVRCVAWNHDGSLLASASDDRTVKLWDPTTMEEKGTLRGHSNVVFCITWNHDRSLLASSSRDKTVKLWDPTTMEEKGTLTGTVASWQGLDPETKAPAAKAKERRPPGRNRTGQYIVTATSDMLYIYKTNADGKEQGEPLACFRSPAQVMSVSCMGTKVVAGCSDGQVLFLEAPLLAVG